MIATRNGSPRPTECYVAWKPTGSWPRRNDFSMWLQPGHRIVFCSSAGRMKRNPSRTGCWRRALSPSPRASRFPHRQTWLKRGQPHPSNQEQMIRQRKPKWRLEPPQRNSQQGRPACQGYHQENEPGLPLRLFCFPSALIATTSATFWVPPKGLPWAGSGFKIVIPW